MFGLTPGDIPTIALTLATLVVLEGLLSADNALVLAVMVRHLPKKQQKLALRYGIWGAFVFRFIAIIFAYKLIQFWQVKLIGGLYLFLLAVRHFTSQKAHGEASEGSASGKKSDTGKHDEPARPRRGRGLWATVLYVELADIAFSIDSILAAVALVEALPPRLRQNSRLALAIIYIGGILGIITMRMVAGLFLVILNRYKGLAGGAYLLVGWIGLKLLGGGIHSAFHSADYLLWRVILPAFSGGAVEVAKLSSQARDWRDWFPEAVREFHWELPEWAFWLGMLVIAGASMAYRPRPKSSTWQSPEPTPTPEL